MMESIPLKNLSFLAEEIHIKTQEALQNTDLDMQKFLAIDKFLQSIHGELLNNTTKLTEINKLIERDTKKLQEVQNDPTYTDEQRQLYKDRLDDLNTKKQARLEIISQNREDLQRQVARIKQTLEKVFDKNTSLAERIRTLFRKQGMTIFSILSIKGQENLKKMFRQVSRCTQKARGKVVEGLTAIVGSVVGAILNFLGKAVGFVAEHTWALIVFVAGLIDIWLMQRVHGVGVRWN